MSDEMTDFQERDAGMASAARDAERRLTAVRVRVSRKAFALVLASGEAQFEAGDHRGDTSEVEFDQVWALSVHAEADLLEYIAELEAASSQSESSDSPSGRNEGRSNDN